MLLSEIVTIILTRSGQLYFLTSTNPDGTPTADPLACIGISMPQLWQGLVKNQLGLYEKYRPLGFEFNREATYVGQYGSAIVIFGDDSASQPGAGDAAQVHDPRVGERNRDPGLVPKWISAVQPSSYYDYAAIPYLYWLHTNAYLGRGEVNTTHEPRTYLWKYERDDAHGVLYVSETGQVDIKAHYSFPWVYIYDSAGNIVDVEIYFLDESHDSVLFDLILGQFLMMVGRSRRAFMLDQSPVVYDASDLVLEGKEVYDQAKQELFETSKFYLALGL